MVYHTLCNFSTKLQADFETPKFANFMMGISEDENGNIVANIKMSKDTIHKIILNYNRQLGRNLRINVDAIQQLAIYLTIRNNIVSNVIEQSQQGSLV